jgi:hypothetical protein
VRASAKDTSNIEQARCVGKWMDKRNSLLQCSYGILAVWRTPESDMLGRPWGCRSDGNCPVKPTKITRKCHALDDPSSVPSCVQLPNSKRPYQRIRQVQDVEAESESGQHTNLG